MKTTIRNSATGSVATISQMILGETVKWDVELDAHDFDMLVFFGPFDTKEEAVRLAEKRVFGS